MAVSKAFSEAASQSNGWKRILGAFGMLALLAACDGRGFEQDYVEPTNSSRDPPRYSSEGAEQSIFGQNGFDPFGFLTGSDSDSASAGGGGGGGIGVNGFLWRASLDTISFMPLSSADPFGGVIITDWYTPPETPTDRFKMNIYILGRQLRADGLRVAVFRQSRGESGAWRDSSVQSKTAVDLENQILTRARQLRIARATTP